MGRFFSLFAATALCFLSGGCSTSPLGRSQLQLFSSDQLAEMGTAAFQNVAEQTPTSNDAALNAYVSCVANHILSSVPGTDPNRWKVSVFQSEEANAFALPGGKIGVYTGMLDIAETQDQLAAVLGHEVAHVIAEHSNERVSTNFAADAGLQLASVIASGSGNGDSETLMSLLGLGTQVGVLLPFGRTQEEEADLLGMDYMAAAGFDPSATITLWQRMGSKAGGSAPPEILSTHPATGNRIASLQQRLPAANEIYHRARSAGASPGCKL